MPTKDQEPKPIDRVGIRFATEFRKYRDIYKAAEKARVPKSQAVKLFNRPEVQDEIERQDEAVREERARQQVHDEKLANEMLDRELIKVIMLDPTKQGSLKLEAIKLGMVATGRIQNGNTKSLDPLANDNVGGTGNFYQAFVPVGVAVPAPAPLFPEGAPPAPVDLTPPPVPKGPPAPPAAEPTKPAETPGKPAQARPFGRRAGSFRIG